MQVVGCLILYRIFLHGIKMKIVKCNGLDSSQTRQDNYELVLRRVGEMSRSTEWIYLKIRKQELAVRIPS